MLFCMLLTEYYGMTAKIIQWMKVKVDSFKNYLKAYGEDIDKFCKNIRKTMECLTNTGGSVDQAFAKTFYDLVESNIQLFNEYIFVWKTIREQSSTLYNIQGLLNRVRNKYQQSQVRKKW